MNKKEAKGILIKSFKQLPKRNRRKLLWHFKNDTPICCGKNWTLWTDGKGGG
jgi:hypothetical protein